MMEIKRFKQYLLVELILFLGLLVYVFPRMKTEKFFMLYLFDLVNDLPSPVQVGIITGLIIIPVFVMILGIKKGGFKLYHLLLPFLSVALVVHMSALNSGFSDFLYSRLGISFNKNVYFAVLNHSVVIILLMSYILGHLIHEIVKEGSKVLPKSIGVFIWAYCFYSVYSFARGVTAVISFFYTMTTYNSHISFLDRVAFIHEILQLLINLGLIVMISLVCFRLIGDMKHNPIGQRIMDGLNQLKRLLLGRLYLFALTPIIRELINYFNTSQGVRYKTLSSPFFKLIFIIVLILAIKLYGYYLDLSKENQLLI